MTSAADVRAHPPRSLLFVPGDRAVELLPKALGAGPDAVILDLEDALRPEQRDDARLTVAAAISVAPVGSVPIFVRVQPVGTRGFEADLATVAKLPGIGVVLPKCAGPDAIQHVVGFWRAATTHRLSLLPIVETARGILAAVDIAAADEAVCGLAFGAEDFAAEAGVRRTAAGSEILVARSWVVLAATAAGRWAVDTPSLDLQRLDTVGRDARRAASLGFAGKLAVHPVQIAQIHAAFAPSASAVRDARRIVEKAAKLAASGRGVGEIDGRMVDEPILRAARRVLERSEPAEAGRGTR